ncbi:MAG: hypothetical protein ABIV47_13520 [Roseiflexaceae bacterium]
MPKRPGHPKHERCRERAMPLLKMRQCETTPADFFAEAKGEQPKKKRTYNSKIWQLVYFS